MGGDGAAVAIMAPPKGVCASRHSGPSMYTMYFRSCASLPSTTLVVFGFQAQESHQRALHKSTCRCKSGDASGVSFGPKHMATIVWHCRVLYKPCLGGMTAIQPEGALEVFALTACGWDDGLQHACDGHDFSECPQLSEPWPSTGMRAQACDDAHAHVRKTFSSTIAAIHSVSQGVSRRNAC